jgi:hypothetical protein
MTAACLLPDFYKSWKDFLIRIERSCEAAERDLQVLEAFNSGAVLMPSGVETQDSLL